MNLTTAKLLVCCTALAGCTSQTIRPGETLERAAAEVRKAAEPRQAERQPDAVRQALLPPVVVEMPAAGAAPEPRFNLAVNAVPANQVFMAMVADTRYSMLVHPDASDPITVTLKDVTVREALDALRELYGYDYKIQGTRIFIQPPGLQTRVFQVNYLMGRRTGRADVRVTSGSIQTPSFSAPSQAGASGPGGQPVQAIPGAAGPVAQSVESSRVTTTSDNDFWRDLSDALNAIVGSAAPPAAAPGGAAGQRAAGSRSEGRAVIVNPNAGVVVVRGYPTDLRNVESFLKAMSLVVERQVMLEAKIIEVTLSEGFQSGINWGAFRTGNNSRFSAGQLTPGAVVRTDGAMSAVTAGAARGALLPGSPLSALTANPATGNPVVPDPLGGLISGGAASGVAVGPASSGSQAAAMALGASAVGGVFGLALQTSSFAALLSFLETHGAVQVLSSPRIATMNNQKAVLKVGTDEFFVTNVTTTTTVAGNNTVTSPTITTQPFFSGIALDVTPQISEDGQITLHVHPSVSLVSDRTKTLNLGALGNFTLPLASSNINESDTVVRVSDGSIVAIGGLMRQAQNDARSQVPGMGSLPGIGGLFRNNAQAMEKSELVILLKTTIIQGDGTWREQAEEVGQRIQGLQRAPARAGAGQ